MHETWGLRSTTPGRAAVLRVVESMEPPLASGQSVFATRGTNHTKSRARKFLKLG